MGLGMALGMAPRRGVSHGMRLAMLAMALLGVAVSCSSEDDEPAPPAEVSRDWARIDVREHLDVFAFDRVAVSADQDAASWVTRRSRGNAAELAYWELRDEADPSQLDLEMPEPGLIPIPVSVTTTDEVWAAVAVTRTSPRGENTGVVAWQGSHSSDPAPPASRGQVLRLPRGVTGAPRSLGIARAESATTVVGLVDGKPLAWVSTAEVDELELTRWEAVEPDLDLDESLVSLRITCDGDRLVLAGVDESGQSHLWTSTDGEDWEAVDSDDLPTDRGAVAALSPVDEGRVVVAWLADEDSAPTSATEVVVQSIDGDELSDEGTVEADESRDIARIDVNDAVVSPDDRLVLVGAAVRPSGGASPMVWAQDGRRWVASRQPELLGRVDYEMRSAVATDDALYAVVTNHSHIDVETWRLGATE